MEPFHNRYLPPDRCLLYLCRFDCPVRDHPDPWPWRHRQVCLRGRMTVNGTLTAVGTSGSPVVFTAYTDDSYGGDSNGNGLSSGTPGVTGAGSIFENTSSSRLEHAVVRYGGSGSQGNVYLYQSNVPVISSNISDGSSFGYIPTMPLR